MSLKKVYEPYFKIGTSVSVWNMGSERAKQELKKHYSSITCENDMKPMYFLDEKENMANPEKYNLCPALNFEKAKPYLNLPRRPASL